MCRTFETKDNTNRSYGWILFVCINVWKQDRSRVNNYHFLTSNVPLPNSNPVSPDAPSFQDSNFFVFLICTSQSLSLKEGKTCSFTSKSNFISIVYPSPQTLAQVDNLKNAPIHSQWRAHMSTFFGDTPEVFLETKNAQKQHEMPPSGCVFICQIRTLG